MPDRTDPDARLHALVDLRERQLAAPRDRYDIVAIGGGTAGLVATAGAAMLGAKTALIERELLGGDCLVTGCVPSKALLHAGRVAQTVRSASAIGVRTSEPDVDFSAVMNWVRERRANVAPHDSVETVLNRGVDVVSGTARFVGPQEVEVGDRRIRFKRALIATGARPRIPAIPGLREAEPLTNETLFDIRASPGHLAIIGAGPIGCEMAQALVRLGCKVSLIGRHARVLPAEDPDGSEILEEVLREEGVDLVLGADVTGVERSEGGVLLRVKGAEDVRAERILVAAGRVPNIGDLDLERAGVDSDARGVHVDRLHRTTNRRIYAAGDVASGPQFTHAAFAQAEYAVLNAFFPVRLDAAARVMPHATYTDPEVAHVGPPYAELVANEDAYNVLTTRVADNDRAIAEGERRGFARVYLRRGTDRVVAATIVSRGAGDLIVELGIAATLGLRLRKLADVIHPYPTRSELVRELAYKYNTQRVTPGLRTWIVRWLSLLR